MNASCKDYNCRTCLGVGHWHKTSVNLLSQGHAFNSSSVVEIQRPKEAEEIEKKKKRGKKLQDLNANIKE